MISRGLAAPYARHIGTGALALILIGLVTQGP
jgi:hypothetical protein